jgi:abortive infection bacteriophage resistance protein
MEEWGCRWLLRWLRRRRRRASGGAVTGKKDVRCHYYVDSLLFELHHIYIWLAPLHICVRVGPLLLMAPIPYTKRYLPIPEQIELLRGRGLSITDLGRAQRCLHRIGYYRLSGYWFPFRHQEIVFDRAGREERRVSDLFRTGTRFQDAMDLYVFDKKLRLLFIDAIERIEVALRVDIALILGTYAALAHRDGANFNAYFSRPNPDTGITPHCRFLAKLDETMTRSREDFVISFAQKYDTPMPIWMCIELWDFGTLSTVLSGMKTIHLETLADRYGLPRYKLLVSWTQSINFVRNICAHHGRLWNRPPVQQPGPTRFGEIPMLDHLAQDEYAQRRLYSVAAALQYLMRTVNPDSSWGSRLAEHLATFPAIAGLSTRHMGFQDHWSKLDLWTTR